MRVVTTKAVKGKPVPALAFGMDWARGDGGEITPFAKQYKGLYDNGVLDALGVKPIAAVGEPFNPHVHEAVVTEATDDFEPDTVMQEIVAGYRLGDKLIRPALVKVATRK